jgi:thiol-disulfide isomerase/thioredoxin
MRAFDKHGWYKEHITMRGLIGGVLALFALALIIALAPPAHAKSPTFAAGWNTDNIAWHDYATGMAKAKADGKLAIVVVHTSWCPHCKQYQTVFQHPQIVETAKRFVMILVDRDVEGKLNDELGPKGQSYVPRTLVLGNDGKVRTDAVGMRPEYPHLIDNIDHTDLLTVMGTALAKP